MLITTSMLIEQLSNYSDPYGRIRRLTCYGELTSVIKGIYETDPDTPGHVLAQAIYGPSYLSFNYALSKYGRSTLIHLQHALRTKRRSTPTLSVLLHIGISRLTHFLWRCVWKRKVTEFIGLQELKRHYATSYIHFLLREI